jgi:L-glyceraldehyde 3-phosphate reductase
MAGETAITYVPNEKRYGGLEFRCCGQSRLALPPISLGTWQNFGGINVFETCRAIVRRAFDRGVTHFDLANMYGPPYGSAEENYRNGDYGQQRAGRSDED